MVLRPIHTTPAFSTGFSFKIRWNAIRIVTFTLCWLALATDSVTGKQYVFAHVWPPIFLLTGGILANHRSAEAVTANSQAFK